MYITLFLLYIYIYILTLYKFTTKEHMPITSIIRKDIVKLDIINLKSLESNKLNNEIFFIIKHEETLNMKVYHICSFIKSHIYLKLSFRYLLQCVLMKFYCSNYSFDDYICLVSARCYLLVCRMLYSITDDIKLLFSHVSSMIIHV